MKTIYTVVLIPFIIIAIFSFQAWSKSKSVVKGEVGRFKIIQLGNLRRDQFLLDTEAGKIWRSVCIGKGGPDCVNAWQQETVIGL